MSVAISGFCDERFAPIRDAFVEHFDRGLEIGASLAMTHRGKLVVDLWAGHTDLERTRLWQRDTIVPVFSTTKTVTAMCALVLMDRGQLDLDGHIATYWPEFAAGGKEAVTVRDALSHQAGVPGLAQPVPWMVQRDWLAITARLAAEPHWFEGRRQVCYHSLTFGFVIGEVIRRVDGRTPAQFFREEIADKIGADFQIGLTAPSDSARVAAVCNPRNNLVEPSAIVDRVLNTFSPPVPSFESWDFQATESPAGIGFGNGRSIARAGAILAMGGTLDGVRFFSNEIAREVAREQAYGECPLIGRVRFGLTFGLDSKEFPAPSRTTLHWGGYGGSYVFVDPAAQVSVGYAPNNFEPYGVRADPRTERYMQTLAGVLASL